VGGGVVVCVVLEWAVERPGAAGAPRQRRSASTAGQGGMCGRCAAS
jgi:hypothetical protein